MGKGWKLNGLNNEQNSCATAIFTREITVAVFTRKLQGYCSTLTVSLPERVQRALMTLISIESE